MNLRHGPSSNNLRDLRRAYQRQRYAGDLGALAAPGLSRFWRSLVVAAALLLSCGIGWQAALVFRAEKTAARHDQSRPIQRLPQIHTLEYPELPAATQANTEPGESLATEGIPERRPILPGLLVMSSPRAATPARPAAAPRVPSGSMLPARRLDQTHTAEPSSPRGPIP